MPYYRVRTRAPRLAAGLCGIACWKHTGALLVLPCAGGHNNNKNNTTTSAAGASRRPCRDALQTKSFAPVRL
ncbi:hypothetical protein PG996_015885 [Apiospora saccharicola]|uniref:Secreted protein n=1 Tax=Apiospora saccharicola TaxID=335842 RepID=A0ABR1TMD6_9PEZI